MPPRVASLGLHTRPAAGAGCRRNAFEDRADPSRVRRRYRLGGAPLVRGTPGRTGRVDRVLAEDFDLLGV